MTKGLSIVLLPRTLPNGLAGSEAKINIFEFDTAGNINQFNATYSTPENVAIDAFNSIQLMNVELTAAKSDSGFIFNAGGTIILPEGRFPKGIGGSSCGVTMLFSTEKGLESINAAMDFPDQKLFDQLEVVNGRIVFDKQSGTPITIGITGGLILPETFPDGLAGLEIGIKEFTIDTTGKITRLDISADGVNADLFNKSVGICEAGINFAMGTDADEFIINITGGIQLIAAGLPDSLKEAQINIKKLVLSTKTGLKDFSAELLGEASVEILGGVRIGITKLTISQDELGMGGKVTLPGYYPAGLANARFDLDTLRMNWSGEILELAGGLGYTKIELAGFTGEISKLYITKTAVTLESCTIVLPANFGSMGGEKIALRNAYFDEHGNFQGELDVPDISAEFAGFTLTLENPSLNWTAKCISFTRAALVSPEFTGSMEYALLGVKLSPSGLSVSGGEFTLPDFTLGEELGFRNIRARFVMYDVPVNGQYYMIAGQGTIFIPGVGTMDVKVSFTDRSSVYPIGLKQAYFEYYAANLGLPLGTTGLYINGIRGGIAFGPPDEMSANLQPMFDNGIRLQLGTRVVDQTSGRVFIANADIWVDITDWEMAFEGDATILDGTFNLRTEVSAAITRAGFYTGVRVQLKFIKGRVEVYIYNSGNATKLAGTGNLQVGLARGCILNKKVLWWRIRIPDRDYWLSSLNAEFGDFNNGIKGFKAVVTVPLFGNIGAFIGGPNSLTLGDVSQFVLAKPSGAMLRSTRSSSTAFSRAGTDGVSYRDARAASSTGAGLYTWTVPARKGGRSIELRPQLMERGSSSGNTLESSGYGSPESAYERMIFVLAFAEGDPAITVTSPSGKVYSPGMPGVETQYIENGLMFAVISPEAGNWSASVSGLEEGTYELIGLKKDTIPSVTLDGPGYSGKRVQGSIEVKGTSSETSGTVKIMAEPVGTDAVSPRELGRLEIGGEGKYAGSVSTEVLADGEYRLYAAYIRAPELAEPRGYGEGSIIIDRSQEALTAPRDVEVTELSPGEVLISWKDDNGLKCKGFYLYERNLSNGEEKSMYLGALDSVRLPGYASGDVLQFSVEAVDFMNRLSGKSETAVITIGGLKPSTNRPVFTEKIIEVTAVIGEVTRGSLTVNVENLDTSASLNRYISLERVVEAPQSQGGDELPSNSELSVEDFDTLIALAFEGLYEVAGERGEIGWFINAGDLTAPGRYEIPCRAVNRGNYELADSFTMAVTLVYPEPVITTVEPGQWINTEEVRVSLYGDKFLPGSRVYLDGTEFAIEKMTENAIEISVPAGIPAGSRSLAVESPGGSRSEVTVEVLEPQWNAVVYGAFVEALAGTTVSIPVRIEGLNGFTDTLDLRIKEQPLGWNTQVPLMTPGTLNMVDVMIPVTAVPGEYTVTLGESGGRDIVLYVNVVEAFDKPVITGLSSVKGFTGDVIEIYGYGFGETGSIGLGDTGALAESWSGNRISFKIPEEAVSGNLWVEHKGVQSEGVWLAVVNRGFSLHLWEEDITLRPEEERTLAVHVTGYDAWVSLSLENQTNGMVSATLDKEGVVPNDVVYIQLKAARDFEEGIYSLYLKGEAGSISRSLEIPIRGYRAFAISTAELPRGTKDLSYRKVIETENGEGESIFTIVAGRLPSGLSLSRDGVISGKPGETGYTAFTVEAVDEEGHRDTAEYGITVEESSWGLRGRDGGNTRHIDSASPSYGVKIFEKEGLRGLKTILTGASRIWAVGSDFIYGLNRSGDMLYKIADPGIWQGYAGGRLYVLRANGVLRSYDPVSGNLYGEREGILSAASNGVLLLCKTREEILIIDAYDSTLRGTLAWNDQDLANVVMIDDVIYGYDDHEIYSWDRMARWESGETLVTVSGDRDGLVCVTAEGTVKVLDRSLEEKAAGAVRPGTDYVCALSESRVTVSGSPGTWEFDRDTMELLWHTEAGGDLAGASTKIMVGTGTGLLVLNRYNGTEIWREEGAMTALAFSSEEIYAAFGDGRLSGFAGPDNWKAPETTVETSPEAPDGLRDWFIRAVTLSINSEDRETWAEEVYIQINEGEYQAYTGAFDLEDGVYQVRAYGIDSQGSRGEEAIREVKQDTMKPRTSYTLGGTLGAGGWYLTDVTLEIRAEDETSGVDYVDMGERGVYETAITLNTEGSHSFSWQGVDKAGNREDTRELTVNLDFYAPSAQIDIEGAEGISRITLTGNDSGSGVDFIEYTVDDGDVQVYNGPFALIDTGSHDLRYRVYDRAGRDSGWYDAIVNVKRWSNRDGLIAFVEGDGVSPALYRPTHRGMRLYTDLHRDHQMNRVDTLPRYTEEVEALLVKSTDGGVAGEALYRFWLRRNGIVFLFTEKGAAVPGDWTRTESGWDLNQRQFPEGADVYMKRVKGGQEVSIPGGLSSKGPLVIVRPETRISARIVEPQGHRTYSPGEDITLRVMIHKTTIKRRDTPFLKDVWYVDYGAGWEALDGDELTLPWTDTETTVKVRVEITEPDGFVSGEDETEILIKNRMDLEVKTPKEGKTLEAGSWEHLLYWASDTRGLYENEVTWTVSRDGETWEEAELYRRNLWHVPAEEGTLYLKGVWAVGQGHYGEEIYTYHVQKGDGAR